MNISVQTNAIFEPLNVVVVGSTGIVYSKVYKEAQYKTDFNIYVAITEDMTPKADVIVFYLRDQDGFMVFDQLELNLGFQGENFVKII